MIDKVWMRGETIHTNEINELRHIYCGESTMLKITCPYFPYPFFLAGMIRTPDEPLPITTTL